MIPYFIILVLVIVIVYLFTKLKQTSVGEVDQNSLLLQAEIARLNNELKTKDLEKAIEVARTKNEDDTALRNALEAAKKEGEQHTHRAVTFQRSVLKGKISEQVAPFLPGFPSGLHPSEARFIGSPIDLIVFRGADNKNIEEVVFVEMKSGKSILNQNENSLKKTIDDKRVKYLVYHIPEEVTEIQHSNRETITHG
jgi:predicted Holliday junction resolvase-like endonuclease